MSDHITINDGELIPISNVKRVSTITQKERESLSNLSSNIDTERFHSRIDYANGRKSYAEQNIGDIAAQTPMVQIDNDVFAPLRNIEKIKTIRETDRARFEQRTGRSMHERFQTQIETRAGNMLSSVDGVELLRRINQPQRPSRELARQSYVEKRQGAPKAAHTQGRTTSHQR